MWFSFVIMTSTRQYLYKRFEEESFLFLLSSNSSKIEHNVFNITDIDLYYHPVQTITIGSTFFLLRMPLVIAGEYVNLKVLRMLKDENGLVKEVTTLFTSIQMIYWPFWYLFTTSTDFIHPLNEIIGEWFCDIGAFLIHLSWMFLAFHSLIVAMMRYYFIVYEDKVKCHGKPKLKKIFFLFSCLVPLFLAIWDLIESNELDVFSFINKCYGNHHKVFLIETSTLDVFKRNFCEFESYDLGSQIGSILDSLRRVSCVAKTTLLLLMSFNITEGIIYLALFIHIHR